MRKRFLSLFCVLALCLGLLSVTALAVGEHTDHSSWIALDGDTTALSNGSYFLSGDVEHNGTGAITVTGTVTLCLNGHVLDLNDQYIKVNSGASLTLCDCTSGTTSGYLGRDGLWHPGSPTDEGATTCNLTGGVITGGNGQTVSEEGYLYNCGGGVVVSGGTFTMTGGNIAGNTGSGGGVYLSKDGAFTMTGGKITRNAAYRGGGVYVNNGTFELSGNPTITGNTKADETTVNNVDLYQLYAKPVITIGEDGLSPVASIGVTMDKPGVFTSGWSTHMKDKDPAAYFSSDSTGYHVALGDDGEASMTANSYTVKFYPNGGATWYAKAQAWVVAKGISDGENPSAAITRQELVTMLWRLAGEPVVNYTLTSPDADAISGWAYEAMRWAVSEGIIEGDENGLIHPTATCTRAEAAAILMRLG